MSNPNLPNTAFPYSATYGRGMSLRDYFAAKALEGLLSDPEDIPQSEWPKGATSCEEATAMLAVKHADILIKQLYPDL